MDTSTPCPNCHTPDMSIFYEVAQLPAHSVLRLFSQEDALNYPKGDIRLGFCSRCGFISNVAFDAQLPNYAGDYEATQGFSPTFNTFHKRLAQQLIDRYSLHEKKVIEIGCGHGEFLALLCELGPNTGVGFDPAFVNGRITTTAHNRLTFIKDFYSEQHTHHDSDFICCKMTLEHIPNTSQFVQMVRQAIGDRPDTIIFFQIPNASYVFNDLAFWDVYYEHCSYFTKTSLAHLFRQSGFTVLNLWTDYDDQYLMIEAKPSQPDHSWPNQSEIAQLQQTITHFAQTVPQQLNQWRHQFNTFKEKQQRVVLWGGGSKAVAFLTTVGLSRDDITYAVDINPRKTGTFLAGTAQEVVTPDFLLTYQPDIVLIMNPIYKTEIKQSLTKMGLSPEIHTL